MAKLNATQYEMNAIKLVVTKKSPELLAKITPELFGTLELCSIFKLIRLGYATSGRVPGWGDLLAEIDRRVTDPDKLKFLTEMLDSIKERDISGINPDIVIKHLDDHRKYRVLVGGTVPLLEAVERKDIDDALAKMNEMYASVHASTSAFVEIDQHDMTNMAGRKVQFNFRKTGIGGIDRRGGRIEGGLMIIGAEAKAGKSTLAVQDLLYAYDNYEGSGAVFSFEQQASELRARILSARSGVDLGLLLGDMMTPEDRLKVRIAEAAHLCHMTGDMEGYVREHEKQSDAEFWAAFWREFKPRENRLYLMDNHPDWDQLFTQMDLLCKMKNVKDFVIDYPFLVPRGGGHRELASWEYNLKMSQKLKSFASQNKAWVTTPAQYDSTNGSLKFMKNAVNDCDLFIALSQEEGDADVPPAGAVTATFKAYRNFLTIPDEPQLQPFKMIKRFDISQFVYVDF